MIQTSTDNLAEILVRRQLVDLETLEVALAESRKNNTRLDQVVSRMALCDEEALLEAFAESMRIPYMKLGDLRPDPDLVELIPAPMAEHFRTVPIADDGDSIRVALADPLDMDTLDELRRLLQREVEPVVASQPEIDKAYNRIYGIGGATMTNLQEEADRRGENEVVIDSNINIEDMAQDASIVKFVNQVVQEAFRDRATDIHIEPLDKELRIRYRIDGMLYEAPIPPAIKRFQAAIISRVKIMADLNIAERRLPQDGKIKISMGGREFDLRVSTVPTPYGESIAIRILSRESELCTLERLGFNDTHQGLMRAMISKPHGILFITGPTGSGKSTTLYASLTEINSADRKIITIEDPIEYRIAGTTQIQVNPSINLTFARVLRTILRQDPDVIMVGETRDPETAQITIQTALTGHLVFSTLHTNDASGAVTRLEDMGIEPFLIASSVEGILAQRLIRLLCQNCKQSHRPEQALSMHLEAYGLEPSRIDFKRPVGCEECRYTGYRGRTALVEIVKMTEGLRRIIVRGAAANEIKSEALKQGMRPIRFNGWEKVIAGLSTIEEVLRVTMEDEFASEDEKAYLRQAMGH
ncbi:MAG: GspE/PulE family protein [Candidatus Sumerlaeia bacterium]|nr:GspE/PulE family protein [Candidatus Sumerlaeia bacterium]